MARGATAARPGNVIGFRSVRASATLRGMGGKRKLMRAAYVLAGTMWLAAAALPALTDQPAAAKSAAAHKAAGKRTAAAHEKASHASPALAGAYAAMPERERLALQADLALAGAYEEGASGGDFDERTIAAVRTFQQRTSNRETGVLDGPQRDALAAAAKERADAVGWRLIEDTATGARLGVPEKLVPRAGASRTGSRWTSAQGQIRIETFRFTEAALPALFEEEKKASKRQITSSALKPDSFVISGVQGLKNFTIRAEASGSELRGVTVLYDQATEGIMAPMTVAVINTFAAFPDPNVRPAGLRRLVEYGSAVVVSSSGDLITSAQLTDACQAIAVPGFGYATRVAADMASDLALIRLYGVRTLVPAPLANKNSQDGELALFGVADPLAQSAADATVTRADARLSGQTIDPAAKPGFAGAAAVDAQGRMAGMVDLKFPVVASSGPATVQAALIPADIIRAFLQGQGVVPADASEGGAIAQSVARVICARK